MNQSMSTIKLYWQHIRKHKVSFFTMLICIPLAALAINALLSFFFSQAIGQLLEGDGEAVTRSIILAASVGLVGVTLNFIGFQAMTFHESRVTSHLRDGVFDTLINKDLRFFVNEKVGGLTSKYIDFVRSHVYIQDLLIIRTIGLVLSLITGLVLIGIQSWLISGVLMLLIIALIFEVKFTLRYREPLRKQRRELRSEIHGKVADSLTNSLVVKTFAAEDRESDSLHALNKRFTQVYWKDIGFLTREGSIRILVLVIVQIVAVSLSASMVMRGEVNVSTAIFILTYLQLVGSQLFAIGDLLNGYEEALLEASPMTAILLNATTVNDAPEARTLHITHPSIDLTHVSYRYNDGGQNVLDDVSLSIPAGQKVGLVGHSGAGKTTITHLLLRFSDVTSGSISIDGHDIRDVTQKSLREHIAYVPQEPLLFHRSLRENIAYGKPKASDEEIRLAAKRANALEFIDALPEGLDTMVGERGVKLSGGQRQRIAIARALLKDAPILILDEATSALDSESEKLIQDSLKTLMEGRTSIVIAHRLSTIASLDRILLLDNGKVAEDGTHRELLAQHGTYAKLWKHQSGGFIEE